MIALSSMADTKGTTKVFGIGSGKGGVGKSTMSVNLGLSAARKGLKTALIDMDPLSNLAVVLDISQSTIDAMPDDLQSRSLRSYRINAAPRLDLLFPRVKTKKGQAKALRQRVFETFYTQLLKEYDCLILDLPAGIQNEENLFILPFLHNLVLVVNPEPTSHVSAGGYIRAALEINSAIHFFIWHNRFDPSSTDPSFNARDVAGNYNRFVPPELQVTQEEQKQIQPVAWIPPDRVLNLLFSEPNYEEQVLAKLEEVVVLLLEIWTKEPKVVDFPGLPLLYRRGIRYALMYTGEKPSAEIVQDYLTQLLGSSSLLVSDTFLQLLDRYRQKMVNDPRRKRLFKIRTLLLRLKDEPSTQNRTRIRRGIQEASYELLGLMTGQMDSEMETNTGGLLLYYVTVLKLLSHPAVVGLLGKLIPTKDVYGQKSRNRNRQIRSLIENDSAIARALQEAVTRLEPIVEKQLLTTAKREALGPLLFVQKEESGPRFYREAYEKLTFRVVHDFMYSGLGVSSGLLGSSSGREIDRGLEELLKLVPSVEPPAKIDS
ncbi:MAG: septum site-determining protein MinD [Spirochaetales bacterium]|nr:septum site-determining protein MinD [Spirochaetales bacterium]